MANKIFSSKDAHKIQVFDVNILKFFFYALANLMIILVVIGSAHANSNAKTISIKPNKVTLNKGVMNTKQTLIIEYKSESTNSVEPKKYSEEFTHSNLSKVIPEILYIGNSDQIKKLTFSAPIHKGSAQGSHFWQTEMLIEGLSLSLIHI